MKKTGIIKKHDVISFDIFDTLLLRTLNDPKEVFLLTGYNCKSVIHGTPKQFVKERVSAAESASNKKPEGECTIEEIYDELKGYSQEERNSLMNEELRIECLVLKANKTIKKVYDYCVKSGKRIIAVSDMYLSKSFLRRVLNNCGYDKIEKIYVSCEQGENKRSGKLFKIIESELGNKKYLHIGDAWKSDYLRPKKCGWNAYHIKKPKKYKGSLISVIRDKAIKNYSGNYYAKIGYGVLGPILFEFCKWLKTGVDCTHSSSVLFFSRDGKIMKGAFDIMYPGLVNSSYFHVSRRVMNTVTLWMHPEFDTLKDYIEDTYSFTISTFLKRLGLFDHSEYEKLGLDLDREYEADKFWENCEIKEYYEKIILENAVNNSKRQYSLFCDYCKKFIDAGNLAIVDIGWRGSMQDRLKELDEFICKQGINSIKGYYIGIESEEDNKNGFLYKGKKHNRNKAVIDAGFGLFETMFLAHEGTTICYKKTEGEVEPVLDEYEISDERMINNLEYIHNGALEYVSDMAKFDVMLQQIDETGQFFDGFRKLCLKPKKEDLTKWKDIRFNDTEEMPLIDTKGIRYYLTRPSRLKTDYHKSPWKIGFLKCNISHAIPWSSIYMIAKSIDGIIRKKSYF